MTDIEQREAARRFYYKWRDKGNEDQDGRSYWLDILMNILGVQNATDRIDFEKKVKIDGDTKKIDAYIPETKTIIEQKSLGKGLDKPLPQSGGIYLTPYQQAKRYNDNLPFNEKAKWIVTSNFSEIWIYNMDTVEPEKSVIVIKLEEIQSKYSMLEFLVNKEVKEISLEMQISMKAGDLVGKLYDKLSKQYDDPSDEELKSLNMLCVRLVFCLYAEDAGVFGRHSMFHDYIKQFDARHLRKALIDLFDVLDTRQEDRDKYLEPELSQFPYVNGGLFSDNKSIVIPQITDEIRTMILDKASADFDWSLISPTIFGAVFESTLNRETRRSGGMHYTSIENIHKVIDPLFLDDLYSEFSDIKEMKQINVRKQSLEAFCKKLGSLKFLDPACGSGNFLTETYISLRRLENKALELILEDQTAFDDFEKIKVTIDQFYGIEINDFAVNVAKTAMWIAESQMKKETEAIISQEIGYLPLTTNAFIVEGNALRIDWKTVVPKNELSYIIGNPPFVGARLMSKEQKDDLITVFGAKWKNAGNLDYVSCWYKKATDLMLGTNIRSALVSTNSVSQGESVAILWKPLFESGVHFDFAHRTFRWDSEASLKAHVHCVIIGFSLAENNKEKIIYENDRYTKVKNISPYLVVADNVFIESRSEPICDIPKIGIGNKPIDDGNYLFSKDEMEDFVKKEPQSKAYFKPWYGSYEFINQVPRYCLWLGDCSPKELRQMPECLKRVENVRQFRLASKSAGTQKIADKPTRFHVENMPTGNFIVIPEVSSEKRKYIPMGFMSPENLCSNLVKIVPNSTLFHFGVLTSNVHMAWMRAVAGRLEMRYRYSKDIVYNNFPWPNPTAEQKTKIEETAQAILDARALYPDCSLADLYDELTMPQELRKAHQANDRAVMQAYGFDVKTMTESSCVAELMGRYREIVKEGQ